MRLQIVDRQPVRVAYLRHVGPYGAPVIRFHVEQVVPWLLRHGWMGHERFGISHDDPLSTDPAACRYDACVALPAGHAEPPGMLTAMLPGGRYAVMDFEGTTESIAAGWQMLLGLGLPEHGLRPGHGPGFEHYPAGSRYDPASGILKCRICVPVLPL